MKDSNYLMNLDFDTNYSRMSKKELEKTLNKMKDKKIKYYNLLELNEKRQDRLKELIEYRELEELVNNFNGTLKELSDKLQGHNYDENFKFFDLNYKSLCCTIKEENNKIILSESYEVYDEDEIYLGERFVRKVEK